MKRIAAIAWCTFQEAVKDRLVFSLLFGGSLLLLSALVVAELTFIQRTRVITDVGLTAITLTGVLMAIFAGSNLFSREIERKRAYVILSKPVPRWQFVIGKFSGIAFAITFNVVILTALFVALLYLDSRYWDPAIFKAAFLILLELWLLAAFSLLFSSFSTPFLSIFYTFILFAAGHMLRDIRAYWQLKSVATRFLTKLIYYVLPNLDNFNIKSSVANQIPVPMSFVTQSFLYWLIYISALLLVTVWLFQYRELE